MLRTKKRLWLTALLAAMIAALCGLFSFGSVGAAVQPVTVADMIQNKEQLLPAFDYQGAERLDVTDGVISCWGDGHFLYQEEVEAVNINVGMTDVKGSDLAFALRTTGGGCMWASTGYYAFVSGTSVQLYRVDDASSTGWNKNLLASGTLSANLYDKNIHQVEFSAVENEEGKVALSFALDGGAAVTATDPQEPLPISGTAFKIARVNSANLFCVYEEIPEILPEEIAPTLTSGEMMAANPDKLLPDYGYSGDMKINVEQGIITANGSKLYYSDEVEGVDIRFKALAGAEAGFTLRATASGAVYSGSHGYALYVTETSYQLCRVDAENGWGAKYLSNGTLSVNLFDGEEHRVVFSAKENTVNRAVVKLSIDDTEIFSVTENEAPLPLAGTEFKIDSVNDPALRYQLVSDYEEERPADYTFVTADDMIASGKLYDGAGDSAGKLEAMFDAVTAAGDGRLIYRQDEVEAVSLNLRVLSGSSLFAVLRANTGNPVWDGGRGYYFMFNKADSGSGMKVQLIKGIKDDPNSDFVQLKSQELSAGIFDGERHEIQMVAYNVTSVKTRISLTVDGTEIFTLDDASGVLDTANTHFMLLSGSSNTVAKLYGQNGIDFEPGEGDYYDVITSKTLFNYTSDWNLKGAVMNGKSSIRSTAEQSIVMFNRVLQNSMINFDLDIDGLGNNWVAILLNANKADMLWNTGFRSNVIFLKKGQAIIEYWEPESVLGSVSLDVDVESRINVECGMYTVSTDAGDYTFIRLAINGVELYNQAILGDSAYKTPGYFGLINYGSSYEFFATENEIDRIPSGTDGTSVQRGDESAMTVELSNENFAPILNSFNPDTDLQDGDFNLYHRGSAAYGDSVDFGKLSFELKFNNPDDVVGQYAEFFFSKKRQDSFIGQTLAGNYTNYGYGLRILPTGTIYVIRTDSGDGFRTLMTIDYATETTIDFQEGYHTFTVYREKVDGGLKISVFVDDDAQGYSVIDTDFYEANYPMDGFLSVSNSANNCSVAFRNLLTDGTVNRVSETLEADAVNFVTYYEADRPYLYFIFDSASYTTRWVEIFAQDSMGDYSVLLGRVYPQNRMFELPEGFSGARVKVVSCSFTEAGNKEQILELKDLEEELSRDPAQVRRIAVKADENGAYFVYAGTDEKYLPVGGNYMGLRGGDHSTFDAATSFTEADYDPIKADAMMRALSQNGGNVLRVFLIGRSSTNPGITGDSNIPVTNEEYYYNGLYIPYMENVVDFLRKAQKYGIYVMMALGDADVPSNAYYMQLQGGHALGRNEIYMTANGVAARKAYAENVVKYFLEKAPDCMSGIFSLEFQNEFAMYGDQWPFNQTSGTVTLANGKSYDMADADSRQAAHEESTIYYLNTLVDAVKALDPGLLCNEGTFTLNIVGNNGQHGLQGSTSGDLRYPATLDVYLSSKIDFVDMHIYFANRNNNTIMSSFADDLTYMNFYTDETQALLKEKPIFMGEFGPGTTVFTTQEAAYEVWTTTARLARESNFQGFACWTLESHSQKECWCILDDDGKFDTFRELVRIMHGVEPISGVTAADVTGSAGESTSIEVKGLSEGDTVWYRTSEADEWSLTNPVFTEEGTYTVYYKVVRQYAEDFTGSARVTVRSAASGSGCNSCSSGSAGAILMAAMLLTAALGKKLFRS